MGWAVLGLALSMGLLGQLTQIGDVSAYGLILWIFALVLLAMGAKRGMRGVSYGAGPRLQRHKFLDLL